MLAAGCPNRSAAVCWRLARAPARSPLPSTRWGAIKGAGSSKRKVRSLAGKPLARRRRRSLAACSPPPGLARPLTASQPNLQPPSRRRPAAAAAAGSSNLGQLQSLAAPDPAASDAALFHTDAARFAADAGVINVDGPAIAASLLVLLLLLALSFNRILGLERLLGCAHSALCSCRPAPPAAPVACLP